MSSRLAVWEAKQATRLAKAQIQQAHANDCGEPHYLNGKCKGERPNVFSDDGMTCNASLLAGVSNHNFEHVKKGELYVSCPIFSCPNYDIPLPVPEGVTICLPQGARG